MKERVQKYINVQIIVSILYMIFGLLLCVFPSASINMLGNMLAIFLIIFGIYMIILDFKGGFLMVVDLLPGGLLSVIMGSLILFHPGFLKNIISIIVGIWIIISSSLNVKISLYMREVEGRSWITTLIIAILSIAFGVLLIANPAAGTDALTSFVGVLIIFYSITNFLDMVLFRKYINRIAGYMKKHMRKVN